MITEQPHPHHPHLKYRYEGPAGLVGYAKTKKSAEKTLAMIKGRYKDPKQVHKNHFIVGKGVNSK